MQFKISFEQFMQQVQSNFCSSSTAGREQFKGSLKAVQKQLDSSTTGPKAVHKQGQKKFQCSAKAVQNQFKGSA
eukprot:8454664-Lingulodinium_polyedra.AAC.1